MSYTVVSDLIDADSCAWKFDVLDRLFDAEVRDRICCIPLSHSGLRDEIIWRCDQSGAYSVKSGYKLLRNGCSAAQSNLVSRFYKQLWAVNLPPKLKITMWRVANKFIPTFASLRSKRLNVNDVCPLCQSSSETLEHLLRDCYFVLELHNALDVSISQSADTDDWFTWLAVLFCSLNESVKMRLIVSYWAVWFTRNKVVHENVVPSVSECVAFCRSFLADCGSFPTDARANTAHQPVAWEAPPVNVFKFNFDAAYDLQGKRTMVGVIGRDNAGNIVASCVAPFSNVADVLVAESLACLQAVRYAKDLGFRRVIFEGDSLTVVKKINEGRLERSVTAPLIYDIRVAAKDFDSVSFTFARSDANRAAHTLARDYRSQQSPYFWIEEAPAGATVAANLDRSKLVSA
ncbi:hypothetical protein V6N13_083809 [Hibiscus sabdariffa]|uniref:Uncharacterized protein n=1 Tax=Hibiscus sabdariffa TaxID=183260 RepID=A0ABR2SZ47_9ROSI